MENREYREYLEKVRKASESTVNSYLADLREFEKFLMKNRADDSARAENAENTDIVSYIFSLRENGRSHSTVNRKIASLKMYYRFLAESGAIKENPAEGIKAFHADRNEVDFLSVEEISRLLSIPDDSIKGRRDRAILELLYATGMRVSELAAAKMQDVNLRMSFIACAGKNSRARIIPFGKPAKAALEDYLREVRKLLVKENKDEEALFVNYHGGAITRQGIWKIISEYADKAGIKTKITPKTLRNSFAVHMVQNGADIRSLSDLLGYDDISGAEPYFATSKSRIKDVYDKTHPRA